MTLITANIVSCEPIECHLYTCSNVILLTIGLCKPHIHLTIQSVQSSTSVKTQVCALVVRQGKYNEKKPAMDITLVNHNAD